MCFFDHNAIKMEMNSRKITGKSTNTWKLNNTLLNNAWVKEEVSKEKKTSKRIKMKICQNSWDTAKAVLRERFIVLNEYIRKEEKFNISISYYVKNLGK